VFRKLDGKESCEGQVDLTSHHSCYRDPLYSLEESATGNAVRLSLCSGITGLLKWTGLMGGVCCVAFASPVTMRSKSGCRTVVRGSVKG